MIKTITAALLLLCLSFGGEAQDKKNVVKSSNVVAPFNKKIPYEVNLGEKDEIAVKILHQMGFIIIEVKLNEGQPVRMLLDTGADACILSKKTVEKHKLKPLEQKKEIIITSSNTAEIDTALYLIETLKIGEATIKHAPFIVSNTAADDFEILQDLEVEGIIGANLFHDVILTLDIPNGQIILGEKSKIKQGQRLDLSKQYYLPVIKSKVVKGTQTKEYDFLIDTGYTGHFKMPICFPDAKIKERKKIITYDLFNQTQAGFISELNGNLQIGDKVIENPLVKYTMGNCQEAQRWGLIGSGYLKFQSVSIDQHNRQVIFH